MCSVLARQIFYASMRRRKNNDEISRFSGIPPSKLLSHGLRTLGDHFDRTQVNAFRIEWTVGAVILDYQTDERATPL